jgi:hypothetical protein
MTRKTTSDPELIAKITIADLLDELSDDEAGRVVGWVNGRWGHLDPPAVVTFPGQPDRQLDGTSVRADR